MFSRDKLMKLQVQFEERRLFPYDDKTGKAPLLCAVMEHGLRVTGGKLTIGVGWNLTARGLPLKMIEELHRLSLGEADMEAMKYSWFLRLNDMRQMCIVDMIFNMGAEKFAAFRRMHLALDKSNFVEAAKEMKDSHWYTQTGRRASYWYVVMLSGEEPELV